MKPKVIERQIRNHEFAIHFDEIGTTGSGDNFCELPTYRVDGIGLERDEFVAVLLLMNCEAPK